MVTFSSDTRPIISRGPSLIARCVFLVIISIALMVADHRYHYLNGVRQVMSTLEYPLQWLVDMPSRVTHWFYDSFADRERLRAENQKLTDALRDANIKLETLAALTEENHRLHDMSDAVSTIGDKRLIARIMHVDMDPLRHRVVLNKGQVDGVFKGQAILDTHGIFGQITQVGRYTSEAIMITDPEHAIPVRVNRTGLRTIAEGTGSTDKLNLPFLTGDADIKPGDLLIASGLGGVFPPGYPVATVTRIDRNPSDTFATVEARPMALLDRDYEVMLIWYQPPALEKFADPNKKPATHARARDPS
ncbi:MAG TPA: rod shape-determining protein MreC [Steroidobacteraceae bacterium]|nr:rod shape-determining protein MreC [Steroidobacteraceae bacterium]